MPSYTPYITTADEEDRLVLELGGGRKAFYFFYFRIFPFVILLLIAALVALIGMEKELQSMMFVMIGSLLLAFWLLVSQQYITRLEISDGNIRVIKNHFLRGARTEVYESSGIAKLGSDLEASAWGKGQIFVFDTSGQRSAILVFPSLNSNREKILQAGHALAKRIGTKYEPKP